jgi:hypothetical protein
MVIIFPVQIVEVRKNSGMMIVIHLPYVVYNVCARLAFTSER